MLLVNDVIESDLPCNLIVDPFVPMSFKTYADLLPGAKVILLGDFHTSLLEIRLDAESLMFRGLVLLIFNRTLSVAQSRTPAVARRRTGLPIIRPNSITGAKTEVRRSFAAGLHGDTFVIDWSNDSKFDTLIEHQRALFYVDNNELCRVMHHPQ
jgi:hypothetical protein